MISILTTAHNNVDYIEEAIDSFITNSKNVDYEILVGIDNCQITTEKCLKLKNKYGNNVRFLFFTEHSGTYVIRNTLVTESKYDKILFFDSDDIMINNLTEVICGELDTYDYIRYKYYVFYQHKKDIEFVDAYHNGTFGINKNVFLNTNGFEPWMVAADGEFNWRINCNQIKVKNLQIPGLKYRRHQNNLTGMSSTGMKSKLRQHYHQIKDEKIKNRRCNPLPNLVIGKFIDIYNITNIFELYLTIDLSIIIPTYKNTDYIDECINSILESSENLNVELLVGIDACEETLNHVKSKEYPNFVKFYYFNENVGPYLIKNSLVKITNSDNILFFDSDDIMLKPTLNTIVANIQKYDCVRLKLQNYTNGTITKNNINYGEGVFAINKQLFLSMNGFEPWRVAADSDFMGRLYNKRPRIFHIPEVSFYYRQHPTSLTKRSDTGMSSQLRGGYHKLSKNKKGSGDPDVLHIANFTQITIDTYEIPKEFDYNNIIRREKLNSVLNPTPRKTIEKPQKKQFSEPTTTRLDELFKNTSNPARVIKTKTPENRQELIDLKNNTTKKTISELFPKKPNYKDGKNFINIGGKFTK